METHRAVSAENWDAHDVANWLKEIGLGEHAQSFQNSKITGSFLLEEISQRGEDEIRSVTELGITKTFQQKLFFHQLEQIAKRSKLGEESAFLKLTARTPYVPTGRHSFESGVTSCGSASSNESTSSHLVTYSEYDGPQPKKYASFDKLWTVLVELGWRKIMVRNKEKYFTPHSKVGGHNIEGVDHFTAVDLLKHVEKNPHIITSGEELVATLRQAGWAIQDNICTIYNRLRDNEVTGHMTKRVVVNITGRDEVEAKKNKLSMGGLIAPGVHSFASFNAIHQFIARFPYPLQSDDELVRTLQRFNWETVDSVQEPPGSMGAAASTWKLPSKYVPSKSSLSSKASALSLLEVRNCLWADPGVLLANWRHELTRSERLELFLLPLDEALKESKQKRLGNHIATKRRALDSTSSSASSYTLPLSALSATSSTAVGAVVDRSHASDVVKASPSGKRARAQSESSSPVSIQSSIASSSSPSSTQDSVGSHRVNRQTNKQAKDLARSCQEEEKIDDKMSIGANLFNVLSEMGWKKVTADWSEDWWKDDFVFTAPWFDMDNADEAVLGLDYFFDFYHDVVAYVAAHGNIRVERPIHVQTDCSKMTIQKRLKELIANFNWSFLRMYTAFETLLEKVDWNKFKIAATLHPHRGETAYWPPWNTERDEKGNYILGVDYFMDMNEIFDRIKRNDFKAPSTSVFANQRKLVAANSVPIDNPWDKLKSRHGSEAPSSGSSCSSISNMQTRRTAPSTSSLQQSTSLQRSKGKAKANAGATVATSSNLPSGSSTSSQSPSDAIRQLLREHDGTHYLFSNIWHHLERLGWQSVTTKTSRLDQTVFVAKWATSKSQAPSKYPYDISGLEHQVDYFTEKDHLLRHIFFHGWEKRKQVGLEEIESRTKRGVKPFSDFLKEENAKRSRPQVGKGKAEKQIEDGQKRKAHAEVEAVVMKSPEPKRSRPSQAQIERGSDDEADSPKSMSATEFIKYTFNEFNSGSSYYLFKRISDNLKELGWKNHYMREQSIWIPPWSTELILATVSDPHDLEDFEVNRDYFTENDDVLYYVYKYGCEARAKGPGTPPPRLARRQRSESDRPKFEDFIKAKNDAKIAAKKAKKAIARSAAQASRGKGKQSQATGHSVPTVVKNGPPEQDEKSTSSLSCSPGSDFPSSKSPSPSSQSSLASSSGSESEFSTAGRMIERVFDDHNAKSGYLFPKVWDILKKESGWKHFYLWECDRRTEEVWVPRWAWDDSRVKGVHYFDVEGLELNREYFVDKDTLLRYVFKYGCEEMATTNATPNAHDEPTGKTRLHRRQKESFERELSQRNEQRARDRQEAAKAKRLASKLKHAPAPKAKNKEMEPPKFFNPAGVFTEEERRMFVDDDGDEEEEDDDDVGDVEEDDDVHEGTYYDTATRSDVNAGGDADDDDAKETMSARLEDYITCSEDRSGVTAREHATTAVVDFDAEANSFAENVDRDFIPMWAVLHSAATRLHKRINLGSFTEVWRELVKDEGGRWRQVTIGPGTTTVYVRSKAVRKPDDLHSLVEGVDFFRTDEAVLAFVHEQGKAHGVDVDQLVRAASSSVSSDEDDGEVEEGEAVGGGAAAGLIEPLAGPDEGLEIRKKSAHRSLHGTQGTHPAIFIAPLVSAIDTPLASPQSPPRCSSASPQDSPNLEVLRKIVYGHANDESVEQDGMGSHDNGDEDHDGAQDDLDDDWREQLKHIFEDDKPDMKPIATILKKQGWRWVTSPPSIMGKIIPFDAPYTWFRPGKSSRSIDLVLNEDYFYRNEALVDYLKVMLGLQAVRAFESKSKRSRTTRSGQPLQLGDAVDCDDGDDENVAVGPEDEPTADHDIEHLPCDDEEHDGADGAQDDLDDDWREQLKHIFEDDKPDMKPIATILKKQGWRWVTSPPSIMGKIIPFDAPYTWFRPGKSSRSIDLVLNEDYFYRNEALVDYLKVMLGLQAVRAFESKSKRSRTTRSGQPLQLGDAVDDDYGDDDSVEDGKQLIRRQVTQPDTNAIGEKIDTSSLLLTPDQTEGNGEMRVDELCVSPPSTLAECVVAATAALRPGTEPPDIATRQKEFEQLHAIILEALTNEHGASVYVCGSPGQGKTLSVNKVVKELEDLRMSSSMGSVASGRSGSSRSEASDGKKIKRKRGQDDLFATHVVADFDVVRIQGTSLSDSHSLYTHIAEKLGMSRTGQDARDVVLKRFRSPVVPLRGKRKTPLTLLIIDEIDKAPKEATKELLIIAGLRECNWGEILPATDDGEGDGEGEDNNLGLTQSADNQSSLILVGIANSINFPQDVGLSCEAMPKVVLFPTYSSQQIEDILRARTFGLFNAQGASMIAKKIAGKTGDIRQVLQMAQSCLSAAVEAAGGEEALTGSVRELITTKIVARACRDIGFLSVREEDCVSWLSPMARMTVVALLLAEVGTQRPATISDVFSAASTYMDQKGLDSPTQREVQAHLAEVESVGLIRNVTSTFGRARSDPDKVEYMLSSSTWRAVMASKDLEEMHRSELEKSRH